ncbi:MAG: HD domain-containing protein [Phycisphaerae bacterium]|nr:HD domain-containing protein [Phycisphaerae bacterium]
MAAEGRDNLAAWDAVLHLARLCDYEQEHTHQVVRLALQLFDELVSLHGLRDRERFWLQCGACLHDIGWLEGRKGHHKTAMRLILDARGLPLASRDRRIVALIARYHRKAEPREDHPEYRDLDEHDRRTVNVLAGILRVADGLDRSHLSLVRDLTGRVESDRIVIDCRTAGPAEAELAAAAQKANVLEMALGRRLIIEIDRHGPQAA